MVDFNCEAIWSRAFVCWKISNYSFDFYTCDGSVNFLFLPGSVLESCTFLRICPFLPRCPFYWHIDADSSLLWSLYICVVCCDFSIFISNFVDLILLPFFLDESGGLFVYFIYLLKEPAFSFVDFLLWSPLFLLQLFLS